MYDFIKNIHTPNWLKKLLEEIQGIIISTILNIGKEYLLQLEEKIIEAQDTGMSWEAKWEYVFKWGKANIPNIKDSSLNLAIELLVNLLKQRNFMKVYI